MENLFLGGRKTSKERQAEYHGNQYDKKNIKSGLTGNLPQVQKERNPTTDKYLSDIADVSEKTYRMGAKILNSDNETTSINSPTNWRINVCKEVCFV